MKHTAEPNSCAATGRASTPKQLLSSPLVMQDGLSFNPFPPLWPCFSCWHRLLIREEQLRASNSHSVLSSCPWYFGAGSSLLLLSCLPPSSRRCVPGLPALTASLGQLQEGHQELEEFVLLETMSGNRDTGWRWRRNWVSSVMGKGEGMGKVCNCFFFSKNVRDG